MRRATDLEAELRGLTASWEARTAAQRASMVASHETSLAAVVAERDRALAALRDLREAPRGAPHFAGAFDDVREEDDDDVLRTATPGGGGGSGAELLRHISAMESELSQARGETASLRRQLQEARLATQAARTEASVANAGADRANAIAQAQAQTSMASAASGGAFTGDLGPQSPLPSWLQVGGYRGVDLGRIYVNSMLTYSSPLPSSLCSLRGSCCSPSIRAGRQGSAAGVAAAAEARVALQSPSQQHLQ